MPTYILYASTIPGDALRTDRPRGIRQQARQGVLQQSVGQVETVAAEPGQRTVAGEFRGRYARMLACEVEELLSASDVIDAVPFYVQGDDPGDDAVPRQRGGVARPRAAVDGSREGVTAGLAIAPDGSRRRRDRRGVWRPSAALSWE